MKKVSAITIFIFIIMLVGCSSDSKSDVYPLTGIETDNDVNNRTVGVMVSNITEARPQTGLSEADIVFEMLAEGNITRFLALYQSEQPEVVGPVRSAREYYFELAKGYNALYVYHGSAKKVEKLLQASGVDAINGAFHDDDKVLFKREDFRVAPHNSYLLFDAVYDQAKSDGFEIESKENPLPFLKEDDEIKGESAEKVQINYASSGSPTVEFAYDATNDTYLRYNDNEQTVELSDDTPIEVENVFIVEMDHEIIDSEGRRAIDIKSGGNGYLIQNGKVQTVEWENSDGRIVPMKDNEEVGFVKGKTWINVIPTSHGLDEAVTITD